MRASLLRFRLSEWIQPEFCSSGVLRGALGVSDPMPGRKYREGLRQKLARAVGHARTARSQGGSPSARANSPILIGRFDHLRYTKTGQLRNPE